MGDLQPVVTKLGQLRTAYDKASSPADLDAATAILTELKIMMTEFSFLLPDSVSATYVQEVALAREILEYATLLSIKQKDVAGFERHYAQVKSYYADHSGELPDSERRFKILAAGLLNLLCQSRFDDFHTELELLSSDATANAAITQAIELEQCLQDGRYNQVLAMDLSTVPDSSQWFMSQLRETLRTEIAECAEQAYESLPFADAKKMLMLQSDADLNNFMESRGWTLGMDSRIVFNADDDKNQDIPATKLIRENLQYALELERII